MNVLIYGAGAVGLGLASCLLKSGITVDILARPQTVQALNQHGLIRKGIFGSFEAQPQSFNTFTSLNEINNKTYKNILVCTKSYDSEQAAEDLKNHPNFFNQETLIVLCQNGWGNAEIFARRLPKEKIFNARVITGFSRPQPHVVEVSVHADSVHVGSLFTKDIQSAQGLAQAITDGDIPCDLSEHIDMDIWAKMLYNCPLNPLGAIFGVPYGDLKKYPSSRQLMDQIIAEIFLVMSAGSYTTHWSNPEAYKETFYNKLIPATAEHYASTLQDIKAHKKTEIDALNGAICQLAKQYDLETPVNNVVYQMVMFLQRKTQDR